MNDVLMRFDAGPEVGFGHAARCIKVARRLAAAGASVAFEGAYAAESRATINALAPGTPVFAPGEGGRAGVAFVDLMVDPEDPDAWDPQTIDGLRGRTESTVYLASGFTLPDLPADVFCIGYQPVEIVPVRPGLQWGMAFSPVEAEDLPLARTPPVPEPGRVLVALGGAPDATALDTVLAGLSNDPSVCAVDVLCSPAMNDAAMSHSIPGKKLDIHRRVPSVFPLLARAEVAIASFGNLCYEALYAGAALTIVGQKGFQVRCAGLFERLGLAASAGFADPGLASRLPGVLNRVRRDAREMRARGRAAIDGRGIARIAEVVHDVLRHGKPCVPSA
jgi:spore coat polysaccharide biosynthesis predicted glycosyltransferase SpsG